MAQHKFGYFTASTISPLLTGKGDKLLSGGIEHAKRIALERLDVVNEDEFFSGNKATEWGNLYEKEAITEFERETFIHTYDHQKCVEKGWMSCTPDAYISSKELLEVKCPFSPLVHLNNITENGLAQYYNQVQFQMMLTERDLCYLVSYDPRYPNKNRLHIDEIKKNTEWQEMCINRIEQAEEIIKNVLQQLERK